MFILSEQERQQLIDLTQDDFVVQQYDAYTRKQGYKRLVHFKKCLYLNLFLRTRQTNPYPPDLWFQEMKNRLNQEIDRLTASAIVTLMATNQATCAYAFNQSDLLRNRNTGGVCRALSLDWMRRKLWNHTLQEGGRLKKLYDHPELKRDRLADKMVALQSAVAGGNLQSGHLGTLETTMTNDFPRKTVPVDGARGFNRFDFVGESVELGESNNAREGSYGYALTQYIAQNLAFYPRGIYLSYNRITKGALQGHAVALLQLDAQSPWMFFDPNHGQYTVPHNLMPQFAADWYQLYRPLMDMEPLAQGLRWN